MGGCCCGLASIVGSIASYQCQLEAEAQVKNLEEEVSLEKDEWLVTTFLALELADKVREQDKKWRPSSAILQS